MKRVLILGASMLQLPAIKIAKTSGYYVGVVDMNPNAPGVNYADEFFNVSTIDTKGVIDAAKKFRADGIMTLATDMPVRSVAIACQELNLPGISPDVAIKATDKYEMIECFKNHSVPHPWFHKINSEEELRAIKHIIEYPCIIKPTDNSGSRGVVLVNNESELLDAYIYSKKESRSGSVLIEEYLQGCEVSVEIMTQKRVPYVIAVTDKITTGAPHFVEMGHSQPSKLKEEDIIKIKDIAIKAVNSIGITSGPAHVEIMLTENGPKLIELGARLGGDYITSHLVPLSTGVNLVEAVIKESCGDIFDITQKFSKASMIKYFTATPGIIKKIHGIDEAKKISGVVEVSLMKKDGDYVGKIQSSNDRIGFVIAQESDVYLAEKVCNEAIKCIKVVTG